MELQYILAFCVGIALLLGRPGMCAGGKSGGIWDGDGGMEGVEDGSGDGKWVIKLWRYDGWTCWMLDAEC